VACITEFSVYNLAGENMN